MSKSGKKPPLAIPLPFERAIEGLLEIKPSAPEKSVKKSAQKRNKKSRARKP
jgi:hypothetical protein